MNYKVTINIDTPEGVKSGYAVRQFHAKKAITLGFMSIPEISYVVKGEAVAIDLGERGILFSQITADSWEEVINAFPEGKHLDTTQKLRFYSSLPKGQKSEIQRLPTGFIVFENMNELQSIRGLHPDKISVVLGEGVKLKSIHIEITDAPVSWGRVDQYLPKNFKQDITDRWESFTPKERQRLKRLTGFKVQ